MKPTHLFLDTEWADLEGFELVSLALISADGQHSFYAERDPLPDQPTAFVRDVVYPLLERNRAAAPDVVFARELRSFLSSIPNPAVIYDYGNDGELLRTAIAGPSLCASEALRSSAPPVQMTLSLLQDALIAEVLEDWFLAHPQEAARRHHALVDANALRMAWLAVNGAIDAVWSPTWQAHKAKLKS